ncbi:hypothetical protein [Streptomyces sp. LBL]|nr:hypothetical protein [Streptomyces sp. LBL]
MARASAPPPAPIDPETRTAETRVGRVICSTLGQVLDSRLAALTKFVPVG